MSIFVPEKLNKWIGSQCPETDSVGLSVSSVLIYPEYVLKISPSGADSCTEAAMLRWLQGRLPVPKVTEHLSEDGRDYLLMERLPGEMACSREMMKDSELLVKHLADALKMWWSLDVSDCPSDQTLDVKLKAAEENVRSGYASTENVDPGTYGPDGFGSPEHLLLWLKENRPEEDLAVSHGDFCLPNIFFENGALSGFLDLGRSGVSDRWQDIALCWRSLRDNLHGRYASYPVEGNYEDMLFEYLGMEKDARKLRYYLLLDELF